MTANTFSTADNVAGILGTDGSGSVGLGAASSGVRGESVTGIRTIGFSSLALGVLGGIEQRPAGVRGSNLSSANDHAGVIGVDGTGAAAVSGALSAGIRGESNTNIGVFGASHSFAVVGKLVGPLNVQGELGSHRGTNNFAVFTFGNAFFTGSQTATGSKSFAEPHPTDPTKEIRFVCLEGPESGTYFRGSAHVAGGFAKIAVPESFRAVTDDKNITVQLTPTGDSPCSPVSERASTKSSSRIERRRVRLHGQRRRRAYKDFEVIRDNESFVPDGPDDRRFRALRAGDPASSHRDRDLQRGRHGQSRNCAAPGVGPDVGTLTRSPGQRLRIPSGGVPRGAPSRHEEEDHDEKCRMPPPSTKRWNTPWLCAYRSSIRW